METSTPENPKELGDVIIAASRKHAPWIIALVIAIAFIIFFSYTTKLK